MQGINYIVEFNIKEGRLDEFTKVADWFVEQCEAEEPTTRTYQWYLSDDKSKCYLHEGFDNSAGLVAHAAGPRVQERLGELLESSDITRFEAFGNPDAEAQSVLDGFGAVVHNHYSGFTR